MNKLYSIRVFAVLLCICMLSIGSIAQDFIPGEIIVMTHKGVRPEAITGQIARSSGGAIRLDVKQELSKRVGLYLLTVDADASGTESILRQIQNMEGVRAAQLNYPVTMRETVPNDPEFAAQWHHRNTGQTGGTSGADISTTEAWDITTGGQTADNDDIVVCIIEGANVNHPDLTANHWINTQEIPDNGIDDDGNGYVDDYFGWNPGSNNDNIFTGNHGTNVAGMIGARGNNGVGAVGANWDVKMMIVEIGSLTTANVLASYGYAYDMRVLYNTTNGAQGAFVVATNASWGIDNANPANYPVWCEFYDTLGEAGILNCGATANNNVNIDVVGDMPTGCTSPYMVAVTATNHNDVRTFSGFGTTSIDVGAPGQNVRTTSGTSGYTTTSGTSFASPLTAGVIALLYSIPCQSFIDLAKSNPQAGADAVRNALFDGVDVIPNLVSEVATGGRINAFASMNLLLDACVSNPCQPDVSATTNVNCASNSFSINLSITNGDTVGQYTVLASVNGGSPTTVVNNQPAGNYSFGNYPLGSDVDLTIQFIGNSDCNISLNNITNAPVSTGCTNPTACNYDPSAVCDDGSCATGTGWYVDADGDGFGDENSAAQCTNPCDGTIVVNITSGGWLDETSWTLTDASNTVILSGGPYPNTGGGGNFTANVNSTNGPFSFFIETQGQFNDNTPTYTLSSGTGFVIATGQRPGGSTFTAPGLNCSFANNNTDCDDSNAAINPGVPGTCGGCVEGCTDVNACNYDPAAQCDNGSCLYNDACGNCGGSSVAGCTDINACNFNPAAGCDDGSCLYFDACGNCGGSAVAGCTDINACNFNPAAGCDDGSCLYNDACGNCGGTATAGCTDVNACNYDPAAGCDDGSCEYASCAQCMGDFNGDNVRNVADLLIMIAEFGCSSQCATDMNGDDIANGADVIIFLGVFAVPCD